MLHFQIFWRFLTLWNQKMFDILIIVILWLTLVLMRRYFMSLQKVFIGDKINYHFIFQVTKTLEQMLPELTWINVVNKVAVNAGQTLAILASKDLIIDWWFSNVANLWRKLRCKSCRFRCILNMGGEGKAWFFSPMKYILIEVSYESNFFTGQD